MVGIAVHTGRLVYTRPTAMYTIDLRLGVLLGFGFGVTDSSQPHQFRTLETLNPINNASTILLNLSAYAENLPPVAYNPLADQLIALLTSC